MEISNSLIAFIVFTPIVLLNFYACYVILTTDYEVKARKYFQLLFVWLLPILGAVTVININRESVSVPKPKSEVGNNTSITNLDRRI